MHSLFLPYLILWRPLGYFLVFIGMVVEGDAVLFAAAFLAHQGFFDFGDTLIIVASGVIIGDLAWYLLGARFNNSSTFVGRWVEKITASFDDHLKNSMFRTLFLSKLTYGMHHPLLMRAGMLDVGLKKFIKKDIWASAAWILVVGGLGYFSSYSFRLIRRYLRYTEFTLLLALLTFFIVRHFINLFSKKRL